MEQIKDNKAFRLLSGSFILFIVIFRFSFFVGEGQENFLFHQVIGNFLGYFTIQSNLLVAVWFLVTAFKNEDNKFYSYLINRQLNTALLFFASVTTLLYWIFIFPYQPMHSMLDLILKSLLHIVLFVALLMDYTLHYLSLIHI